MQTYFDDMGQMVLDEDNPLAKAQKDDPISTLARAKTLAILERSDKLRKKIIVQYLYETHLINRQEPIIILAGANLREVDLSNAMLVNAELSYADLSYANLSEADLIGAHLIGADLSEANLSGADLSLASLTNADLIGADLSGANLDRTDLSGVEVTNKQLRDAESLKEATMPRGKKKHD